MVNLMKKLFSSGPEQAPSRIADYALIGDCETAALVSKSGSIDWLCWPDFSSSAWFAALVGDASNGRWLMAPKGNSRAERKYRDHTLILETTFTTRKGKVLVTDFMPIRGKHSDVVRIVKGMEGSVEMTMELTPRSDYGHMVPWLQRPSKDTYSATAGAGTAYLRTTANIEVKDGKWLAEFVINSGETVRFALTYASSLKDIPAAIDIDQALEETQQYWTEWVSHCAYEGQWAGEVERSLITLKALTYRPTGGIVAAPTTSLPEQIGGDLNWDYRFCWLRDATFTLLALLNGGHDEEAKQWKKWLVRVIGGEASQVQILYGLSGERLAPESNLSWLCGYQNSRPVRLGNQASSQFQLDIFGEVADALYQAREAGIPAEKRDLQVQDMLVDYVRKVWNMPDAGIWEERGKPQQFVYSKVMAWVALDRAIHFVERHHPEKAAELQVNEWKKTRQHIHDQVCRKGFDRRLNSFVVHYGSKKLDASLLLLSLVGFLPGDDPRILGTIRAVQKRLTVGHLLKRNRPSKPSAKQGAFIACSFWLVQALVKANKRGEAEKLFQELLKLLNDVGLLSEEYDTDRQEMLGNFPQALSHIALVNAAYALFPTPGHQHRDH